MQKAAEHLGYDARVTSDPRDVEAAGKVIFPGVGAFGDAMRELDARGLRDTLTKVIRQGKPFLGICLGLQLLFESSEESPGVAGLGVFRGSVPRFQGAVKIPHMGWNQIAVRDRACPIFKGIPDGSFMYFVHSYYVSPKDASIVACETSYSGDFASAVWKDNVYATQFHPEKSQATGLKILKAFCEQ